MWHLTPTGDWQHKTSNALTSLVTSDNEQLYLCTSMSTTPVWPLAAASITGVMAVFRKHSRRQNKSASREAQRRQMIISAHKFIGFSAHRSGLTVYCSMPSLNKPVSIQPMFIHIYQILPSITHPTTGPTALCNTPACRTHTLLSALGSNL